MTKKEKYDELSVVKHYVESPQFQEYVMKPLFEEIGKLKNAYDCQSLRELSEMKGKKWGLEKMISIFKRIETDLKNLKFDLD